MKTVPVPLHGEIHSMEVHPYQPEKLVPQKLYPKSPAAVALRKGDKIYIVQLADILYLEAKGFYTRIVFLHQGKKQDTLICKLLNRVEKEYANDNFFRVHKSFILNIHNLQSIVRQGNLNVEMKTGDLVPVAKRRVQEFIAYVRSRSGTVALS
ncbi:MAG: LytTR family transcriptional regulator DNA-binding domain-containing protein [Chitinophagaceae bacterium]|nr:LytTR family transcriptional regulator DNA-binding domain-containing protein [Chitinophagaceae bacterium]